MNRMPIRRLDAISDLHAATIQMATDARLYAANPTDAAFEEWERNRDYVITYEDQAAALTDAHSVNQQSLAKVREMLDRLIAPTKRGADPKMLAELWQKGVLTEPVQLLLAMSEVQRKQITDYDDRANKTAHETRWTIGAASLLAIFLVVVSAMLIMRDLRNRKLAELELQRARAEAVAANAAKSGFSSPT